MHYLNKICKNLHVNTWNLYMLMVCITWKGIEYLFCSMQFTSNFYFNVLGNKLWFVKENERRHFILQCVEFIIQKEKKFKYWFTLHLCITSDCKKICQISDNSLFLTCGSKRGLNEDDNLLFGTYNDKLTLNRCK